MSDMSSLGKSQMLSSQMLGKSQMLGAQAWHIIFALLSFRFSLFDRAINK
jgi:hypothetical protein